VARKPQSPKPCGGNQRKPKQQRKPERQLRLAYGIVELASMLGWSRTSVWRRIKKGEIKITKLGSRAVVTAGELRRLGLLEGEAE
jgi:predicted DNA-binding transcriptional regulator AlpA